MTDRLTAITGARMIASVPVHNFDVATSRVAEKYNLPAGLVEEVVGEWIVLIAQEEGR